MMDFPEILEPEAAVAAAKPSTDVAKVDIKATALARFGSWRAEAAALVAKYRDVAFTNLETVKGYDALTKAIAEVRAPRFAAQNVSKAAKSELAAISKAVGAEELAVAAYLEKTEKDLVAQKDAEDERRATAKAEAKRIEDERIAKHEAGIAAIRAYLAMAQGHPSDAIARGIAKIEALAFGPEWEEFAVPAANAQCETLDALRALMLATKAAEDAATAAQAERERLARVAEEQRVEAKRLADVQAAIDAAAKVAADKLAAEQAEFAAKVAAFEEAQRKAAAPVAVEPIEPAPAPIEQPAPHVDVRPVEIVGGSIKPPQFDAENFGVVTAAADFVIDYSTMLSGPGPAAVYSDPDDLETLLRDCLAFAEDWLGNTKVVDASVVDALKARLTTALEDF